jgi:hypothetical protein
MAFTFFHDAALSSPVTVGNPLDFAGSFDLSTGNTDLEFWFGNTDAARTAQAYSNPGTDPITVTVTDSNPATGQPATLYKLALTQLGLATANQTINVGTSVSGGAANAVPLWVRANLAGGVATLGVTTDLSFDTNPLLET